MTTQFVRGNILEADVEALVNAVNCVGVMGKAFQGTQVRHELPHEATLA
jgi:hypothetical protein